MTLTPRRIERYGWSRDLPDLRDKLVRPSTAKVPTHVDLRTSPFMPAIEDQGQLGSCTSFAIGAAYRHEYAKEKGVNFTPSHLFVYYGEREIEGTIASDAGAEIRDGMKVIGTLGVPSEELWPYDITKFTRRPPQRAYVDAEQHKCLVYARLSGTLISIKQAIAKQQLVVCGFTVYESFESDAVARTGLVPNPKKGERVLGGHAVTIVGYDSKRLIWRNQWASDWGDGGYFYTLHSFLKAAQVSDFWTCSVIQ